MGKLNDLLVRANEGNKSAQERIKKLKQNNNKDKLKPKPKPQK